MHPAFDLEYDLMRYCLRHWGKWWATHFWQNKEAKEKYQEIRGLDAGTVIAILGDGGKDYKKHIEMYNEVVAPVLLREQLADYAHDSWSRWMRYMFANWDDAHVEMWKRKMGTSYYDLTEKESDRKEADRILEIVRREVKEKR